MGVELRNNEAAFDEMEHDDDGTPSATDSDLVYGARVILSSVSSPLVELEPDEYKQLIIHLSPSGKHYMTEEDAGRLVAALRGLSGAVDYIDNLRHERLLATILRMSLWNYSEHVMDEVINFIKALATSSSGKYLESCLVMLRDHFSPPNGFQSFLKLPRGLEVKDQVLSRVHRALKEIADMVPLSPVILVSNVLDGKSEYDLKQESTLKIVTYVENMLKLESGELGEVVRIPMLAGVVDVLLYLDVQICWDDILQHDSSKGMFEMELEDVEESIDDDVIDGFELPSELSRKALGGNSYAEKLDSLLVLTFEHLESCEGGGRLTEVFETLLESFKTTLLTAYKSKFAQYVIFYACSLDPGNCALKFALMLENIFFGSIDARLRMSAVAYLASYLSRAKFLPASVVASTLERLVDWCFKYVQMHDDKINPEAHKIFYSGCQAIMYLLCFRMRSMMDVPKLKSWLVRLPLKSLLNSKLSPLMVCLPSIVLEFLRQAKAVGLFMTSEKFNFDDYMDSQLSRAFGGMIRLDMFFPFDPCLLKKSDRYIRPNFVFWSMVQPTYDDEDSSDEDVGEAFEGDNDGGMDYGILNSLKEQHLDFDEFDSALNKMSITPKDSLLSRFGGGKNQPMRMPSRIRPSTSPESL